MSRIGKQPISVPKGLTINLLDSEISVKGPKGEHVIAFKNHVKVVQEGEELKVVSHSNAGQDRAYQGLYQRLISNAVTGVTEGFKRELTLVGVGYRAEMKGNDLVLRVGYSHEVTVNPPAGISFAVPEPTKLEVSGYDKQVVGQVAANIRAIRPPEPYKGKGIRYSDEQVRRKEGKTAGK